MASPTQWTWVWVDSRTVQNYISDGTAAAGQFVWNGTATVNPVSGGAIGVGKVATEIGRAHV